LEGASWPFKNDVTTTERERKSQPFFA
jgi:hypothetical protein